MTLLKCKMCGGQLDIEDGQTVVECDYCGTKQTVPTLDNEKKISLFTRANKLRAACDFDKAYSVYESIVAEFEEEAEAYWGLVLCKYGIEYVDDPATGKKVPTCHRTSFDSVMKDHNFEMVMENADSVAIRVYREEAKVIEEIRKGIIEVSSKEEPYDIFICYKETAEDGQRTIDSVLAQDIYTELTDKGYKVFFSRITLEDKLGQEYEPYIFSALNSAKVMLVFGTDYMHFNSVWVKNEWSRFLKLIANGQKKTLIPCYKDIDAYDMPEEFNKLQAQDLGKVGATQDLLRGIEKIIPLKKEITKENKLSNEEMQTINNLLTRSKKFLFDKDYFEASNYANKILVIDSKHPLAHLIILLAEYEHMTIEEFKNVDNPEHYSDLLEDELYINFMKYGTDKDKQKMQKVIDVVAKTLIDNLRQKVSECLKLNQYELAEMTLESHKMLPKYEEIKKMYDVEKNKYISTHVDLQSKRFKECNDLNNRDKYRLINQMISFNRDVFAAITETGDILVTWDNHSYKLPRKEYNMPKEKWNNLVSVLVKGSFIIGLKNDGSVVITMEENAYLRAYSLDRERYDKYMKTIESWSNIVQVCGTEEGTIGLKDDGTLVIVDFDSNSIFNNVRDVEKLLFWEDNISRLVLLHKNKTLSSISYDSNAKCFKSEILDFTNDFTDVTYSGVNQFAVIKSNGECYFYPSEEKYYYSNIEKDGGVVVFKKIYEVPVAITYENKLLFGTNKNPNSYSCAYVESDINKLLKDYKIDEVVGITGSNNYIWIISKDGRVYETGYKSSRGLKFKGQTLFSDFDSILKNSISSEENRKKVRLEKYKLMQSYREKGLCQYCGGILKGLFTKKCVSCGKPKDY